MNTQTISESNNTSSVIDNDLVAVEADSVAVGADSVAVGADSTADGENLVEININPQNLDVQPVIISNLIHELPPVEPAVTTFNFKSLSPLEGHVLPTTTQAELVDRKVEEVIVLTSNHFVSENSNSQMDIDYELMEHTAVRDQAKLTCEEENKELLKEEPSATVCQIVNNEKLPDSPALSTHIEASFIAMESSVPEDGSANENNLDGSFERHILSKSSEYVVQDVGHEVRIFLTKKRKKSKNAKVTC